MRFVFSLFMLLATSSLLAQTSSLQDVAGKLVPSTPVTIYTAKEIHTMDAQLTKAEAVAIRDGKFITLIRHAERRHW